MAQSISAKSISSTFDFNYLFNEASQSISTFSSQATVWTKSVCYKTYPRIANICEVTKKHLYTGCRAAATTLWKYKISVIGSLATGLALMYLYQYWKNRPQKPLVYMESTGHIAKLSIAIPPQERLPLNVTLTFCVDQSGSMQGERGKAVKEAMLAVLNDAKQRVDASQGVNIEIAIVGFNDTPSDIVLPTKLLPAKPLEELAKKINSLGFTGGTQILTGVEAAVEKLTDMAKKNRNGSHTLILLTDGEDDKSQSHAIRAKRVSAIKDRLASHHANLFAIGIGKGHDQNTLTALTPNYVDTTKGTNTIQKAVATAYEQTLASFNALTLTTPHLPPGTWSLVRRPEAKDGNYILGTLKENETRVEFIQIHGERLPDPVDLSQVTFELSFKDPSGKPASVRLPWNPTSILIPEIFKQAFGIIPVPGRSG